MPPFLPPHTKQLLKNLPSASAKRIAVRVKKGIERKIRDGHPWIYQNSITDLSFEGDAGDLAVIFDGKRKFLGIGLYDPHSPIRIKLLHSGSPAQINAAWFQAKIKEGVARRLPLADEGTTGYRVIYGEGDYLPGLIVDRYAGTLVIKLYSEIWIPHLQIILDGLKGEMPEIDRIVLRLSRILIQKSTIGQLFGLSDGQILYGAELDGPVQFYENRLLFAADVIKGHKTGFFFDHRENRKRVGVLAKEKRVLDLFAYAGGFSLYAAAGGARQVTSLDISRPALDAANANFRLNESNPKLASTRHDTLALDVFDGLAKLAKEKRRFDLIVSDPPNFAKSQDEVDGGVATYSRLIEAILPLHAPQGILVFASCSSHIPAPLFFSTLFDTAEWAGRPLWEQMRTGHALDHPTRSNFPEGSYLKCLYATTID